MAASASVVIASRNEGERLLRTLDSMLGAAGRMPFEIIVVDDGSADSVWLPERFAENPSIRILRTSGLGVAPARNVGARLATGEMLVFCDAHIAVPPGWLDRLARVLEEESCDAVTPGIGALNPEEDNFLYKIASSAPVQTIGCGRIFRTFTGNTWIPSHDIPMECPIASGGCFAVRREVWERVGGYEDAFRGYGYDEEEISLKLWLFGFRVMTAPQVVILHKFRIVAPYALVSADMLHNQMYTALCHFSDERTQRILDFLRGHPQFDQVFPEVFTPENLQNKRQAFRSSRLYDDDWYFQKFSPAL